LHHREHEHYATRLGLDISLDISAQRKRRNYGFSKENEENLRGWIAGLGCMKY
jgi:hypothetical protein